VDVVLVGPVAAEFAVGVRVGEERGANVLAVGGGVEPVLLALLAAAEGVEVPGNLAGSEDPLVARRSEGVGGDAERRNRQAGVRRQLRPRRNADADQHNIGLYALAVGQR